MRVKQLEWMWSNLTKTWLINVSTIENVPIEGSEKNGDILSAVKLESEISMHLEFVLSRK